MPKEVERCRLDRCRLSGCVRRPSCAEGSIARVRVEEHWPLENLIIEKTRIVWTLGVKRDVMRCKIAPFMILGVRIAGSR